MKLKESIIFLWKYEHYFFVLFVLLTAIPVLSYPYFPTVDGPAHLHNGNLLKQLWFMHNSMILDFFDLNKHLNSNVADHLWFAVFGLFLPSWLVEKSILLFYLIALPFSFRYLAKALTADVKSAALASYLIFSFVYSFTFRIGFFNFSIGIPILFWTLGLWIRERENLTVRKTIRLSILATILYISHLFNFMLFGIIVLVNELQYILKAGTIKGMAGSIGRQVLIFLPGVALFVLFLFSNSNFEHSPPSYIAKNLLVSTILSVSPVITLSYEREIIFARIIGITLCVLLLLVIFKFFRNRKTTTGTFRPQWIYVTLVVLLLFFVFPDWIASGGYISIRWALYFFLMLLILITAKGLTPKQLMIPVLVLLVNHLFFINYHTEQTKLLSEDAETLSEAENHMDNNSVLLPLNYSTNWIQINHAGYMSTKKCIINLDNYEPTKPHFPLIWKKGEQVYDLMPGYGNRNPPCINIDAYEKQTHHHIDYLSQFDFDENATDSCSDLVKNELRKRFLLIYESKNKKLRLYKRMPGT